MVLNSHGMKSKIMHEINEKCRVISSSRKPVLIIGEFGSGKGWIAKNIHELSDRKGQQFLKLNCNSLQQDEIERKLFGFLSFTESQSIEINRGLFEKTDGGTLFFEGFETLPVNQQQKVIESIQKRFIKHVGSSRKIMADVRLIASVNGYVNPRRDAINRNENSIYEINPHIIFLPPLRNRREDIIPLIYNFLESSYMDVPGSIEVDKISPKTLYQCIHYNWPGNIRQLKNAITLAILLSDGNLLKPEHLPESICRDMPEGKKLLEVQQSKSFQEAEKNLFKELLNKMYSPEKIASTLGIDQDSVEEKIRRYQLEKMQAEI